MGKLVHIGKRVHIARVQPKSSGNAQILIFTGVRYERDGTPVPGKPVRIKRKRV